MSKEQIPAAMASILGITISCMDHKAKLRAHITRASIDLFDESKDIMCTRSLRSSPAKDIAS